jgi:hypothetical protein
MLWICLGIIVVSMIAVTGFYAFLNSDMGRELMMNSLQGADSVGITVGSSSAMVSEADRAEIDALMSGTFLNVTQIQYVSNAGISGGFLLILIYLIAALFTSVEFESGFAKNVFSVRSSKIAYFLSKIIVMLVVTLVFLLLASALAMLGVVVFGLEIQTSSAAEWALWFGLTTLVLLAYELIVAAVVWATRSKVAGIVVALVLATALVGTLLSALLNFLFPDVAVVNLLLHTSFSAVSQGTAGIDALGSGVIVVVALIYVVISGAVGLSALSKRDV